MCVRLRSSHAQDLERMHELQLELDSCFGQTVQLEQQQTGGSAAFSSISFAGSAPPDGHSRGRQQPQRAPSAEPQPHPSSAASLRSPSVQRQLEYMLRDTDTHQLAEYM